MPRHLLAFAAALAIPAYVLTHESFEPIEHRVQLQGSDATWAFQLAATEPLFLEFEYIVQSPDDAVGLLLRVNDTDVVTIQAPRLYVTEHAVTLVPANVVRAGENRLHVKAMAPASATFEMNLRLHNYYGINARFPRAFIVADDALSHFFRQRSVSGHVLRFGVFYLVSLMVVWTLGRISRLVHGVRAYGLMAAASILPWTVVLYAAATPLHIWVPVATVVVLAALPCLLFTSVIWMSSHRRLVAGVVGPAIVTVVVLELVLRVFNYFIPTPIFYADTYSRYRGRPGAPFLDSHLNSLGFNDIEYERTKPPGVYRLAAIGDSVAFGMVPYSANYLTLLETEFAPDERVQVINFGVPGTGPKDYLAALLQEGLAFNPDLTLVSFYIGNDFELAAKKPREYSFAATSVYFLWRVWSGAMPAVVHTYTGAGEYSDDAPTFDWEEFLEIEVGRAGIYVEDDGAFRTRLARAVGYLRDMRAISERAGAKMAVVLVPAEVQIDRGLQDRVARAHGSSIGRFDFARPTRLLAAELSREGIPYLDLLPVFDEAGRHTRLYKPRDTHWNIAGNRLAATTIAAFLRGQQVISAQ